jgi:glutathione synthase/RimK-type ligase-like ATP-grasp enzyme
VIRRSADFAHNRLVRAPDPDRDPFFSFLRVISHFMYQWRPRLIKTRDRLDMGRGCVATMALRELSCCAESGLESDESAATADVVVVDASLRQALVATRSLGRRGLRVGTAESMDRADPRSLTPAFASRWSRWDELLPSYSDDPDTYSKSVLTLARDSGAQVVIPSSDGSIAALRSCRRWFDGCGVILALASEPALAVANDKRRTLDAAQALGIAVPRTVPLSGFDDIKSALHDVGFPAVIKPTQSWVPNGRKSLRPISKVVLNASEAFEYVSELFQTGSSAIVQNWVGGPREAVNLLYGEGRVRAAIAQVAYRTAPVLGGVSVIRETIPMRDELKKAAFALIESLGLEGYSEVEFRRDRSGRPLIMEINARLTAGIELGTRAGVDFPGLIWRWATGQPTDGQMDYRSGLRMRFLGGDFEWLWENIKCQGRPDSVRPTRATAMFAREFIRRQGYDYVDRSDLKPAFVALARGLRGARHRAQVKLAARSQSCDEAVNPEVRTEELTHA